MDDCMHYIHISVSDENIINLLNSRYFGKSESNGMHRMCVCLNVWCKRHILLACMFFYLIFSQILTINIRHFKELSHKKLMTYGGCHGYTAYTLYLAGKK